MSLDNIPEDMKSVRRWGLWKFEPRKEGGKPSKIPYYVNGKRARTSAPDRWATYTQAEEAYNSGEYEGLGFCFGKHDGYVGVDLDDCRNKETGEISQWAQDIVERCGTYSEVSPSGTGIKVFGYGRLPLSPEKTGKSGTQYHDGSIEFYQHGRYFTVTGAVVGEKPLPVRDVRGVVGEIFREVHGEVPASERCSLALNELPESVEGDYGSNTLFLACCEIARYGIEGEEAFELISEYNEEKCTPQWSDSELRKKLIDARKSVVSKGEWACEIKDSKMPAFSLGLVDYCDFREEEYVQEFLVDNVVVSGEHLVIGGPKKCLKTSILADLCLSMASGTPFLGKFPVKEPVPVMLLSGESGEATIQKTLRRIEEVKGKTPKRGKMQVGFTLPRITSSTDLSVLEREISNYGIRFAAIDPMYLCMFGAGDNIEAGNVFSMGVLLSGLTKLANKTGVTLCLCHHARKPARGMEHKILELGDLAFTGLQEWARQWMILNHRETRAKGMNKLWMHIGGSAGHGDNWAVDIDEGQPDDPLIGRSWDVTVKDACALSHEEAKEKAENTKELIVTALLAREVPSSLTKITQGVPGVGRGDVQQGLNDLVEAGRVKTSLMRQGHIEATLYALVEGGE